jgi:nucleoside-diphosphate-sugar epimerase
MDWETYSSELGAVSLEELDEEQLRIRKSMLETDPPRHTELRRICSKRFSALCVWQYEDWIRDVARDVRDVARMHLLALERDLPSGGRYLGVADVLWLKEIARAVKDAHGARARKASTLELPNWATRLIGLFDSGAAAAVPNLDRTYSVDTSRTRAALGIEFIPASQAAAATAESLFEHGIV